MLYFSCIRYFNKPYSSSFVLSRTTRSTRNCLTPPSTLEYLKATSQSRTKTTMPTKDDTSLFPSATGTAYSTTQKHVSSDTPLKFYSGWFCPFAQRAWMALEEKNIPYEYIEINPYHKAPEFLELNPRGLVPTLGVPVSKSGQKQKPLYESSVIVAYLDEVYDTGVSLMPEDGYERARCRIWIDHVSTRIIPSFYRWIQHTPEKDYSIEEARADFFKHTITFAREIDEKGPFFLGERFSMVDLMLAPWAFRLFLIDHYKPGGIGMPQKSESDKGEDGEAWNRWRRWVEATMERRSVKDTISDQEKYIEAYKRYAEDTTGSEVGQATRKGRGLP